jgi:hypothetical protein
MIVSVFLTACKETVFLRRAGGRVADYLDQVGGATCTADTRSISVLRADGSVITKREPGLLWNPLDRARLMPADAIVAAEDFSWATLTQSLKDWSRSFHRFGLGAAAIKVLWK